MAPLRNRLGAVLPLNSKFNGLPKGETSTSSDSNRGGDIASGCSKFGMRLGEKAIPNNVEVSKVKNQFRNVGKHEEYLYGKP